MPREKMTFDDMTVGEVEAKVAELKEELFNLRFRNAVRQLDDPLTIRYTRRDLARCMSALSEHRKGIRKLAGGDDV